MFFDGSSKIPMLFNKYVQYAISIIIIIMKKIWQYIYGDYRATMPG